MLLGSQLLLELVMAVLEGLAKRSNSTIDDEVVEAIRTILQEHLDGQKA